MRVIHSNGPIEVSFVLGKAKLAALNATTIPRLELCAAVLAVELVDLIQAEEVVRVEAVSFYSDSKVVLGYIANQTRHFYVYVSNRVEWICRSSSPEQWHYVPSELNPADLGTRSVEPRALQTSSWIEGPQFLHKARLIDDLKTCYQAQEISSSDDPEV